MGYFSNGTESMDYAARWCANCVHADGPADEFRCAVWLAHLLRNYEECNDPESVLHVLIPRRPDGLGNEQCRMFFGRQASPEEMTADLFKEEA